MKRTQFVARYFNFLHIFVIVMKCGAEDASTAATAATTKSPTLYISSSGDPPNPVAAFVNSAAVSGRALFSPRVEYNEWMPVGRGDPLKNDPTYDYSPPFLERVRYWETGKQEKTGEILLLGVPSKKPSLPTRKDFKYLTMRRNFYQLPTILMPPPMHTTEKYHSLDSWSQRPKDSIAEGSIKSSYTKPMSAMNYGEIVKPSKASYLHAILQKETLQHHPTTPAPASTTPSVIMQKIPSMFEAHQSTIVTKTSPSEHLETSTHFIPTAPPTLTTDSYFSHYNQPPAPISGPMYLIIEGHSKVKTYSSSDPLNGKHHANIVPVVSTEDPVVRRVVNEEAPNGVKHLHFRAPDVKRRPTPTRTSAMDSLLSFLDVSFGGLLSEENQDQQNSIESNGLDGSKRGDKRQAPNFQNT